MNLISETRTFQKSWNGSWHYQCEKSPLVVPADCFATTDSTPISLLQWILPVAS